MKTTTNFSFRQITLRFTFLLVFGLMGIIYIQAQTVQQYADTEITQLMADMNAGTYDIYELTTSGGQYVLTSSGLSPVTSPKSFILRAAAGLAQKPVLSFSAATNSGTRYMFYPTTMVVMQFEGLAIDGVNPLAIYKDASNTGQPNFIRTFTAQANTDIIIRDCYFYNFSHKAGLFRIDGAGTSLDIQRTTFKNCVGNIINFQTASLAYGALVLKNNTFSDMTGATSAIAYAASSSGTNVTIDHCTMNNFNTTTNIFLFKTITGQVNIKNSLFKDINGKFEFANPAPTMDSCYLEGFATVPTGTITNSFTGTVPAYANAATLHYGLTNKSSFICADGLPVGNTMYYLATPVASAATSVNATGFTANWSAVPNAAGYDVLLYQGVTLLNTFNVNAPLLSYAITELTTDVTYTYKVIAKNSVGFDSDLSAGVDATPSVSTSTMAISEINMIKVEGKTLYFTTPVAINIYNLQGAKVLEDINVQVINTNLNAGIYILQFTNKVGKIYRQKIYVN